MFEGKTGLMGRALALGVLGSMAVVSGAGTACLSSLPAPIQCPPASVYNACALRPPASASSGGPPGVNPPVQDAGTPGPGPGGPVGPNGLPEGACVIDFIDCLREQGRTCACSSDVECKRNDSTTCTPAPDCPASVRSIDSEATCIETSATFAVGPKAPCACGCSSCAATCDGQGPIIAPNETIRFDLPGNLPATGRLGVMARMRGGGRALFVVRGGDTSQPLGDATADADFSEAIVRTAGSRSEYSWGGERLRPVAIELHGGPESALEVDCVVPFLSR